MFSKKSDEWGTPIDFYNKLNKLFGPFTLDPCASDENHKCDKYYTIETNGLEQSWEGETVFVNPPYSDIKAWIKKSIEETKKPNTKVVLLIPARTDTKYFHELIVLNAKEVYFIKGRLKFSDGSTGLSNSAPFPSMIVVFDYYYKYCFYKPNVLELKTLEIK